MWPGNNNQAGGFGGGGPPQWPPIQQSAYADMPHESVDWAALAKQWIKQKDDVPPGTGSDTSMNAATSMPGMSSGGNGAIPSMGGDHGNGHMMGPGGGGHWGWGAGGVSGPHMQGWGQQPHPNPPTSSWNNPSLPPLPSGPPPALPGAAAAGDTKEGTSVDYGHGSIPFNAFEYNHGGAGPAAAPFYPPEVSSVGLGGGGGGGGLGASYNTWGSDYGSGGLGVGQDDNGSHGHSPIHHMEHPDQAMLAEMAKRKKLPQWIREGLEKMENDKQKEEEKKRLAKEREEAKKRKQDLQLEAEEELKRQGKLDPSKSRFDSDNDSEMEPENRAASDKEEDADDDDDDDDVKDDDEEDNMETESQKKKPRLSSPVLISEEEKEQQKMIDIRRELTSILMEVTNDAMRDIAETEYRRVKRKAAKGRKPVIASKGLVGTLMNNVARMYWIMQRTRIAIFKPCFHRSVNAFVTRGTYLDSSLCSLSNKQAVTDLRQTRLKQRTRNAIVGKNRKRLTCSNVNYDLMENLREYCRMNLREYYCMNLRELVDVVLSTSKCYCKTLNLLCQSGYNFDNNICGLDLKQYK